MIELASCTGNNDRGLPESAALADPRLGRVSDSAAAEPVDDDHRFWTLRRIEHGETLGRDGSFGTILARIGATMCGGEQQNVIVTRWGKSRSHPPLPQLLNASAT
jgi:hypothetical protein